MSDIDYTFRLGPKSKTRYSAGDYNQEDCSPRYELDYSAGPDCNNLIEISQFLMGNEGSRIWVWDIENKSTWPVFIKIKKDGQLIKYKES